MVKADDGELVLPVAAAQLHIPVAFENRREAEMLDVKGCGGRDVAHLPRNEHGADAVPSQIRGIERPLRVWIVVARLEDIAGRPRVPRLPVPEPVVVEERPRRPEGRPELLVP